MTGMGLRDYRVHRYVNAFCPHCREERPDRPLKEVRRLSGWLAVQDDRVWLERGCPDDGLARTLDDELAETLASCPLQQLVRNASNAYSVLKNVKPHVAWFSI